MRTTSPTTTASRATTRVAKTTIRSTDGGGGGSDRLEEGDKVEADYRGRGKFYPENHRDSFGRDVRHLLRRRGAETRVAKRLIRKLDGGSSEESSAR